MTGLVGKSLDLEPTRPGFGAWLCQFPSLGLSFCLCKMKSYLQSWADVKRGNGFESALIEVYSTKEQDIIILGHPRTAKKL